MKLVLGAAVIVVEIAGFATSLGGLREMPLVGWDACWPGSVRMWRYAAAGGRAAAGASAQPCRRTSSSMPPSRGAVAGAGVGGLWPGPTAVWPLPRVVPIHATTTTPTTSPTVSMHLVHAVEFSRSCSYTLSMAAPSRVLAVVSGSGGWRSLPALERGDTVACWPERALSKRLRGIPASSLAVGAMSPGIAAYSLAATEPALRTRILTPVPTMPAVLYCLSWTPNPGSFLGALAVPRPVALTMSLRWMIGQAVARWVLAMMGRRRSTTEPSRGLSMVLASMLPPSHGTLVDEAILLFVSGLSVSVGAWAPLLLVVARDALAVPVTSGLLTTPAVAMTTFPTPPLLNAIGICLEIAVAAPLAPHGRLAELGALTITPNGLPPSRVGRLWARLPALPYTTLATVVEGGRKLKAARARGRRMGKGGTMTTMRR
jgi:hypothetical protein